MRAVASSKSTENRTVIKLNMRESSSPDEILATKDFEQMSADEIKAAQRVLAHLRWSLPERLTRRTEAALHGTRLDVRQTLRKSLRTGGNIIRRERRRRQWREPPVVILCDISGSMSTYARMCLHFLHGLTQIRRAGSGATHTFLFGTRLTNVTRALRLRDPDSAVASVALLAPDWDGGTRIADALAQFNRNWARRVLSQGAVVLLITDGLERDGIESLDREASRLHRSAKRVVWLNPLLRYDAFVPKAQGVKTLMKNVDELRPVHNLQSVASLVEALGDASANDLLHIMKARAA
jgi:uncharacterized protein with von Willebrand factor type A (vWA) domain